MSCFTQTKYNNYGIGLVGARTNNECELRLLTRSGEFNNFVNQRNRHIVDNEPTKIFEIICGLRTASARKTCN
jgi:hypothetical protein